MRIWILEAERGGAAGFIHALFPRSYVDVNRAADEIDSADILAASGDYSATARAKAGLGVIPVRAGKNQKIYAAPLREHVIKARIDGLYRPYHKDLAGLIARAKAANGRAFLMDLHSMPDAGAGRSAQADIVLGDAHGTSCSGASMEVLEAGFRALGYSTVRNTPYAGGFTTVHYGRPDEGVQAIQIEINRALYWDQVHMQPLPGFERLSTDLKTIISRLKNFLAVETHGHGIKMAAE
jgi:N-formylglutamate amidohydrolase